MSLEKIKKRLKNHFEHSFISFDGGDTYEATYHVDVVGNPSGFYGCVTVHLADGGQRVIDGRGNSKWPACRDYPKLTVAEYAEWLRSKKRGTDEQ